MEVAEVSAVRIMVLAGPASILNELIQREAVASAGDNVTAALEWRMSVSLLRTKISLWPRDRFRRSAM
jgi:hypothetical protein